MASFSDRIGTFVRVPVSSTSHQVGIIESIEGGVASVSTSSGFNVAVPLHLVRRALLVIVDLNGVLAWRSGKSVSKRPFVDEFIAFLVKNFVVAVWTSSQEHNGRRIVDEVFGPRYTSRLCFTWFRDRCTPNPNPGSSYGTIKDLAHVFQAFGRSFDAANTIIVDDSPEKCSHPLNSVCPPQFSLETPEDVARAEGDDGLKRAMHILTRVLEQDSLAALYDQGRVFGMTAVTKTRVSPPSGTTPPSKCTPPVATQPPPSGATSAPAPQGGPSPVAAQPPSAAAPPAPTVLPPTAGPALPLAPPSKMALPVPRSAQSPVVAGPPSMIPAPRSVQAIATTHGPGSNRNSPSVDLARAVGPFPTTPAVMSPATSSSSGGGGIDVASALMAKLGPKAGGLVQRTSPSAAVSVHPGINDPAVVRVPSGTFSGNVSDIMAKLKPATQ